MIDKEELIMDFLRKMFTEEYDYLEKDYLLGKIEHAIYEIVKSLDEASNSLSKKVVD